MEKERRKNLRVLFDAEVDVISEKGEGIRSKKVRDISLKGVYVISDEKPAIGEICNVEIKLDKEKKIRFKGKVIRHDEKGFVIAFLATDLASLGHLKNVLYYNSGDPERIDKELKDLFGLK